MHRIDGEGATPDNKFTEGNPTTGTLATTVTADFMTALQEEIAAVIEGAGIPLVKTQNDQLMQAIQSLIAGGGVSVSASGVSIADAGGYYSGAEVESALQQLAAKIYAGTLNSNQVRRSIVQVDDGVTVAVQLEAGHAENYLVLTNVNPMTYTLRTNADVELPNGTAVHITQGGAGKVTVAAAAGVTLLKAASFNARTMEAQAVIVAVKTATNTWRLGGMLEAA